VIKIRQKAGDMLGVAGELPGQDMDELDRRLIGLLRGDGRMPAAVLAKALKVSRGTVQNRIDRLRADGAILGFTVRLAPDTEPGRVRAVMTIEVEGRRAPQVLKALQDVPEVEAVHTTNGRWDLLAELSAADLAAFSGALDVIRQIEGVAATETSLLLQTHRF
jgi:DNA-binding Lrp family transcriptional regulator